MTRTNHIAAIIPAYSPREVVNNSVLSLSTQWIPDNTFHLEIIIVNDNPDKGSQYDWYLSDEFKKILKPNIEIRIITHLKNSGQGVARNTGIDSIEGFFILCDEDDMYAPNAVYRMWEILNKEHLSGEDKKPVSILCTPIYSFDKDFYRNIIPAESIWVNAKLYNKEFLDKYGIRFPTDENSHRAEDYPFSRMVEYAANHDEEYKRIDLEKDVDTFYYWYPNPNSRSRCDKYYGSLLSGYTMRASVRIFDFIEEFNKKNIPPSKQNEEDEILKHTILNMTVYAYYNFFKILRDINDGYDMQQKEWSILTQAINDLRDRLLIYWDEIVPSDIYDELHNVKHHSDVQFVESWRCDFKHFVEQGDLLLKQPIEIVKDYCKSLKFDAVNHEVHSSYVKAWESRHNR